MSRLLRFASLVLLLAALTGLAADALAQTYPSKPVRMVVPWPPGGPTDVMARVLAQRLGDGLGQTVVIENRSGANGIVGSESVSKATPDGYTILFATVGTHAINVSLYRRLPYDPVKDFAPVAMVGSTPNVLLVHPSLPVQSVSDLVALAKAKPGQLNYASGGNGATNHLAGELFKSRAQVDMVHVPYQGNAAALVDLQAGRVPVGFQIISTTLPLIKAGKMRALAVTSKKRSAALPDVPTVAEAGLPGSEVDLWWGVFAPAATPREIVGKLNAEIVRILGTAEMRQIMDGWTIEPGGGTPEQFGALIKDDIVKWAKVVESSGARLD